MEPLPFPLYVSVPSSNVNVQKMPGSGSQREMSGGSDWLMEGNPDRRSGSGQSLLL